MPRRIRSTIGEGSSLPKPVIPRTSMGSEIRRALCPVCGRHHGYVREVISGVVVDRRNFWEFERDPNKPFGIIQTTNGRGTMSRGVPFSPEEDTDGFHPWIKYHLLSAILEWRAKGWLTQQELLEALR